jgi:hypothetical protein
MGMIGMRGVHLPDAPDNILEFGMKQKISNKPYVGCYYNPDTGMYARMTQANYYGQDTFSWKLYDKLPPQIRDRIPLIAMMEHGMRLPDQSMWRWSKLHKGIILYFIYGASWTMRASWTLK